MPLRAGKSKAIVSQNISEFHTGKTYAHTLGKFGKKKADAQAIAVALSNARRYGRKYADGGDVEGTEDAPPSFTALDSMSRLYNTWKQGSDINAQKMQQAGIDPVNLSGLAENWQKMPGMDLAQGFGPGNIGMAGATRSIIPKIGTYLKDTFPKYALSKYQQALAEGTITKQEFEGFREALSKPNDIQPPPPVQPLDKNLQPINMENFTGPERESFAKGMGTAPELVHPAPPLPTDTTGWHYWYPIGEPKWVLEYDYRAADAYQMASKYLAINKGNIWKAIKDIDADYGPADGFGHSVMAEVDIAKAKLANIAISGTDPYYSLPKAKWFGPDNPYPELEGRQDPADKALTAIQNALGPDWRAPPTKAFIEAVKAPPKLSAEEQAAIEALKKMGSVPPKSPDPSYAFAHIAASKDADVALEHLGTVGIGDVPKYIKYYGEINGSTAANDLAKAYIDRHGENLLPGEKAAITGYTSNKAAVGKIFDTMKDYVDKGPSTQASEIKGNFEYMVRQNTEKAAEQNAKMKVSPSILAQSERLGMNQPSFHGTPVDTRFEEFRLPDEEIGIHSGTQQAAHDIMGKSIWDPNYGNAQDWLQSYPARIYPVMIKANRPLDMPDLGSWPTSNVARQLKRTPGFEKDEVDKAAYEGAAALRKLIMSKGYDSIRYANRVEDPGSISYISLDPSHIRSQFAQFDPNKAHLGHLAAGLAGAGWIGAHLLQKGDRKTGDNGMARGGKVLDRIARKYAKGGPAWEAGDVSWSYQGDPDNEHAQSTGLYKPGIGRAGGGPTTPWFVRQEAKNVFHEGMLHSPIPGRTDRIPLNVPGGAYVLPADIPSALGQGNSQAGGMILDKMFKSGPYGMSAPKGHAARINTGHLTKGAKINVGFAHGGGSDATPIVAAGGEYIISADTVRRVGGGDIKHGFKILDAFVKHVRHKHIKTLKKLPGPAKD